MVSIKVEQEESCSYSPPRGISPVLRRWTSEDDPLLVALVRECGGNWDRLAAIVNTRYQNAFGRGMSPLSFKYRFWEIAARNNIAPSISEEDACSILYTSCTYPAVDPSAVFGITFKFVHERKKRKAENSSDSTSSAEDAGSALYAKGPCSAADQSASSIDYSQMKLERKPHKAMREGIEPMTPGRVEPHPSHIAAQQACLKDIPDTPQGLLNEIYNLAARGGAFNEPNVRAGPHPAGPFDTRIKYHGPYGDAAGLHYGITTPDPAAEFQRAFKKHGPYAQAARRAAGWDKHVGVLNEYSYPDSRIGANADCGFAGDPDYRFGCNPDYSLGGASGYTFGGDPGLGFGDDPDHGFGGDP